MGDRLTNGLEGRCHWLDMLGGDEGKVNVQWHSSSGQLNSLRLPRRRDLFGHWTEHRYQLMGEPI